MKTFYVLILITALIVIGLTACSINTTPTEALTPITVQLKWFHQSQFAGFYAAVQNEYYIDEGLDVTFIEGGPAVDLIAPIIDGTAQFAIVDAAQVILAKSEGSPIQAIGTVYRRNPLVFISKANLGITNPMHIVGKRVRTTSEVSPAFHAMMAKTGITSDQYAELTIPSTLETFEADEADVWGVYSNGFVLTVQQAGYEINTIYPDDYGIHFYADTIVTRDDLIINQPDLVLRFLQATLKGWTYAIENPDQVSPMVVNYKSDADPAMETQKMIASIPLINTGEDHIGWMRADNWTNMAQTLLEQGVLTTPVDISQLFTMQFLEEIYK